MSRRHVLVLSLLLGAGLACTTPAASRPTGSPAVTQSASPSVRPAAVPAATANDKVWPPRMITRFPAILPLAEDNPPNIDIRVEIDTTGTALMATLQLSGNGAVESRDAIQQWLARSKFLPAHRGGTATAGGTPVVGTYTTHFAPRAPRDSAKAPRLAP